MMIKLFASDIYRVKYSMFVHLLHCCIIFTQLVWQLRRKEKEKQTEDESVNQDNSGEIGRFSQLNVILE